VNPSQWLARQQAFATALLDPLLPAPDFLRARTGAALAARFNVYRNNVHSSLSEALLAAFPVTARLVGEEFFRALARDFLRLQPPRSAALHDYGGELPAFIRQLAEAAPPYLADVAALEHAWWRAYGAADAPSLAAGDLATMTGDQLLTWRAQLHPATQLIASAHPVHGIWAAHQTQGEPTAPAYWGPECALITRPAMQVQVRHITCGQHAFLAALATGATLESGAEVALGRDAGFDPGTTLLLAIEAGAIQELHP
jgi:hypothetical protein